jgi:CBS-domain-containing membrane protein
LDGTVSHAVEQRSVIHSYGELWLKAIYTRDVMTLSVQTYCDV